MVRNINQFQTVYSFLIAPIFYLSGVFFPLGDRPVLSVIVQFSPFYHGVRLLQLSAWGQWHPGEIAWHLGMLLLFTAGLCYWAYRKVVKILTT
ncbi:ABC transporter permease [Verrucomicrobium spinosum]|nr:ABC transporter permease [Verrucomicrobium spinosum]